MAVSTIAVKGRKIFPWNALEINKSGNNFLKSIIDTI